MFPKTTTYDYLQTRTRAREAERTGRAVDGALCIFVFSFSFLFMIGYTVNILGAIVRYRSIVLTLLLIPVVACADWKRVGRLFGGDMVKK